MTPSTDFLTLGGGPWAATSTLWYPVKPTIDRREDRRKIKLRGYSHMAVLFEHSGLGPCPEYSLYDQRHLLYRTSRELDRDEIGLIAILLTDDGAIKFSSMTKIKAMWKSVIADIKNVRDLILVPGLETNETWDTHQEVEMFDYLKTLIDAPIFPHNAGGGLRHASTRSVAGYAYQFESDERRQENFGNVVASYSGQAHADGKRFAAFEYETNDETQAMKMGNAALARGADWVANGSGKTTSSNQVERLANLLLGAMRTERTGNKSQAFMKARRFVRAIRR